MLKINRENLKSSHQLVWFIIDFLMLGLLIINLAFIIWDSIYNFVAVQNLLKEHAPAIQSAYHPIHERFIFYDLIFVSIFLTEFFVRWVTPSRQKSTTAGTSTRLFTGMTWWAVFRWEACVSSVSSV